MRRLKLFVDLYHHFHKQLLLLKSFYQNCHFSSSVCIGTPALSRYDRATSFPIFCLFNHGTSRGKIYKCGVRSRDFCALGKMKSKYTPFIPESLLHTSVTISCVGTVDIPIQFFLVVSLYFTPLHWDNNAPLRAWYCGLSYEYIFFSLVYLTTSFCVLYSTLIEYLVINYLRGAGS